MHQKLIERTVKWQTKKALIATAFTLMLTIAILITNLPIATAKKAETIAFMSLRPNPIGLNQQLLVNAWTSPAPPENFSVPGPIKPGTPRTGYMFYITDPDENVDTIGPITSYGEGTCWFTYMPDQVGEWTIRFTWDGDDLYTATDIQHTLVVQQDPIPSWPPAELPTEPWDFPVNPENREWASIMGGWWEPIGGNLLPRGYDSSGTRWNPYTQAPESSHILWKLPAVSGEAGLVGEPYGQTTTYSANAALVSVVMCGRGYYKTGGMIHCIDINAGEELWATPGSYSVGTIDYTDGAFNPVLFDFGSGDKFIKYDALTGAVLLNITGVSGFCDNPFISGTEYCGFVNPYVYIRQSAGTNFYLLKLDTSGTSPDIESRIVWNASIPIGVFDPADWGKTVYFGFGIVIDGDVLFYGLSRYSDAAAFNTTTGEVLWSKPIIWDPEVGDEVLMFEGNPMMLGAAYGNVYMPQVGRQYRAVNLTTGDNAWLSELTDYPWGNFWAYGVGIGYDQVYGMSYAGVYAFNASTGKINWHYSTGDSGMETPYGTWPFGSAGPVVADGKVYAPTTEHSPTLYYRGQQLHCIDAYSGTKVWSIMGYYAMSAVAEGKVFGTNAYDGCSYCFGKGETATTVSVQNNLVAKGESILIEGTVLDMSPAQEGTAAISDASMSDWMEYLHMQQPLPMDTTGVAVSINAVAPDGQYINIGTATSNTDGKYALLFTPTLEGTYEIIATFEGSESYYSSHVTTYLGVGPAAPTEQIEPEPTPEPEAPVITTEVAIIAAVAVVAVIGIAAYWALKKRK